MMQQLVSTLHERQQHYIVMVDPAVRRFNDRFQRQALTLLPGGLSRLSAI